jgi:hypothetical protein
MCWCKIGIYIIFVSIALAISYKTKKTKHTYLGSRIIYIR